MMWATGYHVCGVRMRNHRYCNLELAARGAESTVWKALDRLTGQLCAIKTGSKAHSEAQLALELHHPYIAAPIDHGVDDEWGEFAVYPFYGDPSLKIFFSGVVAPDERLRVALQLAEVLCFLHNRGWFYVDFKPENFLVSAGGIVVLDLGLCRPITAAKGKSKFSGTFPYIPPESLLGRPYDARSDIFSLGMLLLHSFFMEESWQGEPSMSALMSRIDRRKAINGFWGNLLSAMTAIEPGQRVSSAFELWQKLLPAPAASMTLFFPVTSPGILAEAAPGARMLSIVSSSACLLQAAENSLLLREWKLGVRVFSLDLSRVDPQEAFSRFCSILTGRVPENHFEAIRMLQEFSYPAPVRLGSRRVDKLAPREAELLQYIQASLSNVENLSLYTTSTVPLDPLKESVRFVPAMGRDGGHDVLSAILPYSKSGPVLQNLPLNSAYPEEILKRLRENLPAKWDKFWPAAARSFAVETDWQIEADAAGRKILLVLALADGSLPDRMVHAVSGQSARSLESSVNRLLARGMIVQNGETLVLQLDPAAVRASFRKIERRTWAQKLAAALPAQVAPEQRYPILARAGMHREAAVLALRLARQMDAAGRRDDWRLWTARASRRGAKLPANTLLRLSRDFLRKGEMRKASWLLKKARAVSGKTLRIVRARLDFLHRSHKIQKAIDLVRSAIAFSSAKGRTLWTSYFKARLAGLLILQQSLEPAEQILVEMRDQNLPPGISGLVLHYSGLVRYYQSRFPESISFYHKAARLRHEFRVSTIMNMGTAYLRQNKLPQADRMLQKALRLFQKTQEAERLSHCYNNLGVAAKREGRLEDARNAYEQAIHLARLSSNRGMLINCMMNLAVTFEAEGKTDFAIATYERIVSEAEKYSLRLTMGRAFSNLSALYAIKGQRIRAIQSSKAGIRIKKQLGSPADLGDSYENLGLSLYSLGRYRSAVRALSMAKQLFANHNLSMSAMRIELLQLICRMEAGEHNIELPDPVRYADIHGDSVESALLHYVRGAYHLNAVDFRATEARQELYDAERIFRKLPSLVWLARTLRLKSRYHEKKGNLERAALAQSACIDILSKVGAVVPEPGEGGMQEYKDFYSSMVGQLPYRVLVMIKDILSLERPDEMIALALNAALEFSDMERAVLILQETPPRIFRSASVEDQSIADICEISSSALDTASETVTPFVCLDAAFNERFQTNPSIVANRIMSIVCLPFKTPSGSAGVLYLDSREGVESLTRSETVLMEIFASIIGMILDKAVALERSQSENLRLKEVENASFPEFLGVSRAIMEVQRQIHKVLESDITVLITGETGTGKELVARVIHHRGTRRNGPFVAVNCSAFTKDLLESEMFGHEKGAFTGAIQQKRGLFEQADTGTFFLDEVGEMPIEMQVKLLRVLESREFRRVGGVQTLHTSARLVLATNQDLESMVHSGTFREDLFYRIKGVQIRVPPLRERPEDIPVLAASFLKSAKLTTQRTIRGFSVEALDLMKAYAWPGNARQLKHEIERIVALSDAEWIEPADFEQAIRGTAQPGVNYSPESLRQIEKRAIMERLREHDWNVLNAARSLGLSRHGLYSKMKRFGIPAKED